MKNILFDIKTIIPLYTEGFINGIGRSTYELLKAISDEPRDFEITLFSQNTRGITAKKDFQKLGYLHFYMPDRPFFRYLTNALKLRNVFKSYDLIQMPNNNQDRPEDISKTIFTIHDLAVCKYPELWSGTDRTFFETLRNDLRQCKHIVTCSESTKHDIIDFADVQPEKITVALWGVNRDIFHPSENKQTLSKYGINGTYFFSSSCNHPRKNGPVLFAAYREYVNQGGLKQLVLLNPLENELSQYSDLVDSKKIIVCRRISDAELVHLYTHAHCTFLISSFEGFGFPILESLCCGTQVISANNTSLPEAGGDIVKYVGKIDVDSVLQAIIAIDNLSKEETLDYKKCEIHLSRYTWKKCAEKYIDMYNNLLA